MGIRHLFQVVVTAEDVKEGKPDPEIFRTASDRLGIAPVACLVIEDAVAGVQAARRAGIKCLAVSNTHSPDRLREADLVVNSLREISVQTVTAMLQGQ
ncbi:MAG: HAD family phosphatase [Chloroflexi bacterium]|nr:HAD family phosphatase [Chloroflexota bacterium]